MRMKVLLTAFDPFGGESINPAQEAVKLVPEQIGQVDIVKCYVPTVFGKSVETVSEAIQSYLPDAVLCIGQAGGRPLLTLERVAINLDDAPIPDNAGNQPVDRTIFGDGKNAYFSTLPVKAMAAAIREAGIPATISYTAGTFVCNHLMYGVLYTLENCSLLSEELRDLGGAFRRTLSGIAANSSAEKFAYQLASSMYSEPVGLYYGEKYFGEEAKKDITEIVKQIVATYQKRIETNDILEPATKKKAILKLSKMGLKLGYPDRVEDIYAKLIFDETKSLFDIVSALKKIRMEDNFAKLGKEVDRTHWAMPGHMVNACYDPFVNDITFPAAILQPPFYSINQTRSENLGGIGAVIGHEISHAFDSNGAKCDELGNLNNWWTKTDERKFNKRVNAMIKQFDGIELPWGVCNGKFTVSENIADNGGMAVTLDIMSNSENVSFEEYFSNWARVWCQKAKPEYQALLLQVDVHGPCYLRANMPPRNFPEWYAAFNVKKTDGMYLAPSKRVVIW